MISKKVIYILSSSIFLFVGILSASGKLDGLVANHFGFFEISILSLVALVVVLYRYIEVRRYSKKIDNDFKIIDKYVLISYSDLKGRITYMSQALYDLNGYTKEELIGKPYSIFRHPDTDKETFRDLWETIQSGKEWRGEIRNLRKDSSCFWVDILISPNFNDEGVIIGYTALRHDITDKKRIEEISVTDQLTKIPNRLFLDRTYDYEVNRSIRYGSRFSAILLDIDNFKNVNDTYGHDIGDKVLIEVAIILKESIRKTDVIGRWGGEEFLIYCHKSSIEQSVGLARKIKKLVEEYDFTTVGRMTCSFGVSEYKSHDKDKEMIKRADIALYRAKTRGKNCVKVEV